PLATDPAMSYIHALSLHDALPILWELSGDEAPNYDSEARTPLIVDTDATLVTAHSEKEDAKPIYKKGFGFYPRLAFIDRGRPGCGQAMPDRTPRPITSD